MELTGRFMICRDGDVVVKGGWFQMSNEKGVSEGLREGS